MCALSVGPFELLWPIGTGGASTVWKAQHRQRGTRVAIKLLPPYGSTEDSAFILDFQREVRAVAALSHPNVVQMFDYGFISADEARDTNKLIEGSPFLVMEFAQQGCMKSRPTTTWQATRAALIGILHGLAHAHAHGLIHRDIKPSNILISGNRPLLTDFGLAERFVQEDISDRITRCGTPEYMAPEQYQVRRRDFGPWTDLYAFGCLAWTLATGHPPFDDTGRALEWAHTRGALRPFRPLFPVPDDTEAWLHRLLEKDPYRRFRRAADARCVLENLGDARLQTPRPALGRYARAMARPGIPARWPEEPQRRDRIKEVGLGLFGMRAIPLIDRIAERDILWEELRTVHRTGETRAVILKGDAGIGKSHLAHALCLQAEATGSARTLCTTHARIPTKTNGIAGMLMRLLNAWGLNRVGVTKRSKAIMTALGAAEPDSWLALAEVALLHTSAYEQPQGTLRGVHQRHAIIATLLRQMGRERPTILWIDDAHWGAEALALALAILDSPEPVPTLLAITVREEALAHRPDERALINQLTELNRVRVLPIPPLPYEHQRTLLDRLVNLEPDLASRIARQTQGNPQFAVHLIGDWVDRKILVPTDSGFTLHPSERGDIPAGVEIVWDQQIERVLARRSQDDEVALELAACLGQHVDEVEWAAACRHASVSPSDHLLESLSRMGLARSESNGWCFAHSMLRERLERRTKSRGREAQTHRFCALGLADLPNHAERLGMHLVAAEYFGEALEPLLEAIHLRGTRSEFGICRSLIATYDACVVAAKVAATDPRSAHGQLVHAEVLIMEGDLHRAEEIVEEVADRVRENNWPVAGGRCWKIRAEIAMRNGQLKLARDLLVEVIERFRPKSVSHVQTRLARIYIQLGELEAARLAAEEAVHAAVRSKDRRCGHGELAYVAKCQGRLDDAENHLSQATPQEDEDRYRLAHVHNLRGEILREKRDFGSAEHAYRQSLAIWRAIGVPNRALYSTINLGILLLVQGRYEEVLPLVCQVRHEASVLKLPNVIAIADIALLSPTAATGRWDDFDEHFAAWKSSICKQTLFDTDLALMLEIAAGIASDTEQFQRAHPLFEEAAAQWRQLGFPSKAARCDRNAHRATTRAADRAATI